jgi:hypothetical protein
MVVADVLQRARYAGDEIFLLDDGHGDAPNPSLLGYWKEGN